MHGSWNPRCHAAQSGEMGSQAGPGPGDAADKDSQALLNLLYTIAEDQARKGVFVCHSAAQ
jgi:hypothetical protein